MERKINQELTGRAIDALAEHMKEANPDSVEVFDDFTLRVVSARGVYEHSLGSCEKDALDALKDGTAVWVRLNRVGDRPAA